jgi:peptidoglycan/LPS O-acetylase OafA/YrhL
MTIRHTVSQIAHAPRRAVDWLQPPASGDFYFPELDGLRALAILVVLVHHAWAVVGSPQIVVPVGGAMANLTPIFSSGHIGVNLFFVLSGFLLSFPFLNAYFQRRPAPSVSKYYVRRFLRIAPAFYVAVLLQVVLGTTRWFQGGAEAWRTIPAHLTFLFNFSILSQSAINGAFWTLSIEMQFYIVLPLILLLVFKRKALLAVLGVIALGLGWRFMAFQLYSGDFFGLIFNSEYQLPYQLLQFGVGIAACAIYLWIHHRRQWVTRQPQRMRRLGIGLSLVGVTVVVWLCYRMFNSSFWSGGVDYYFLKIGITLGFGCLLMGTLYAPLSLRQVWRNSPARFIGIVSYGIYLWHFPLFFWISTWPWLAPLAPPKQLQILLVIGPLIAILAGFLSLVLVERPFIRLGSRKTALKLPTVPTQPITDA